MQIEVNYQTKKDAADPNPQNRVFRVHFFVAPSMPQRAQIIKGLSQLGIDFDENSISFYASNRTDVKTTKLN